MRYFPIQLLNKQQIGTDILGNPIMEELPLPHPIRGRFTPWTTEDIQLVGRDVTKNSRKILTDAPLRLCREACALQIGKERYSIQTIKDLNGRWRLLIVERWRQK